MTYTKGPWLARGREIGILTTHGDFAVIAEATAVGSHPGANARLIAQSPALLAALKALIAETEAADNPGDMGVGSTADVMEKARAAILAAEGSDRP